MTVENKSKQSSIRFSPPWGLTGWTIFLTLLILVTGWHYVWGYPFSKWALPFVLPGSIASYFITWLGHKKLTLVELAVVTLICWLIITWMFSGAICWPAGTGRLQCRNNLKQIMLAMHNYADVNGSYPPASVADNQGRPIHSWRVLILPYIDQRELYDKYRFDEPWDGPNNRQLHDILVPTYICPDQPRETRDTSYVAIVGPETMWPEGEPRKPNEAWREKLMVAEVSQSGIHWMEPRDIEATQAVDSIWFESESLSSEHRDIGWSQQVLGANAAFADGTARFLSHEDTTADDLARLIHVDDKD
ncbi:MAG: DUF1559 domain-containing protein [Planctomycetaceae bacterium]|nr:DUF1559 domain-containing protein [Planctomycetaceae bacterium]